MSELFKKKFYKMRLSPQKEGLSIWTDTYLSIHETPCYHYVIHEQNMVFYNPALMRAGETPIQYANRTKRKVYKVHKDSSRFAFETPQLAFKHLQYLKRKQLEHMKRDMIFLNVFLRKTKGIGFDDLPNYHRSCPNGAVGIPTKKIDDTRELVHEHLVFE